MTGHLGVDPGKYGAWALLDERGVLLVARDFPLGSDGEIDVVALADTWRDLAPAAATVELVGHISTVKGRKMGVNGRFAFPTRAGEVCDGDPSLFWYHRFGRVMLAATHGHETKLQDLPAVMAARRSEDWGLTRFRYAHGFHIHHKRLLGFEAGAVVAESHQAPVAQDAWHHGAGFLSGRSLQTITYHRQFGEVSRAREAILDAQPEGTA